MELCTWAKWQKMQRLRHYVLKAKPLKHTKKCSSIPRRFTNAKQKCIRWAELKSHFVRSHFNGPWHYSIGMFLKLLGLLIPPKKLVPELIPRQPKSEFRAGFFLVRPRKKTQGEKTQEFRNSSKKLKLKHNSALFGIFVEKIQKMEVIGRK